MVNSLNPMIIFIQETMMEGDKAKEALEPWLKGWSFGFISSEGHLGGQITTWNKEYEKTLEEKHSSLLKIVLKEKASGKSYTMYNVYRPYLERKRFWEEIFISGLIEERNVILCGDLNLTLYKHEN